MRQVGYLQRLYRDALSTEHKILPLIIRAVRWAKHVERKTVQNFFVAEPEDKRPFGRQ